jgi:hypothetical protein
MHVYVCMYVYIYMCVCVCVCVCVYIHFFQKLSLSVYPRAYVCACVCVRAFLYRVKNSISSLNVRNFYLKLFFPREVSFVYVLRFLYLHRN